MRRPYIVPKPKPADAETRAHKRLRQLVAQIDTLAQLEAIIANGNPEHQGELRALITPMLSPDLPCCGRFKLSVSLKKEPRHSALCPTRKLVTLN